MPCYHLKGVHYRDSGNAASYNTLDVCLPQTNANALRGKQDHRYWIIFLHGGAWHDPYINSDFAQAAIEKLNQSPILTRIAGFASINYRLSPHPNHHAAPSKPGDYARSARHPEHLEDVMSALTYLEDRFAIGHQYLLVGHSCGATLAFQTVMFDSLVGKERGSSESYRRFFEPRGIVGVAGLYDLVQLRDMDTEPPTCQDFLESAFGHEEEVWKTASPVSADYNQLWEAGRAALLVTSKNDQYVSITQQYAMSMALKSWADGKGRNLETMIVDGRHDDVWQYGDGLVACVEKGLSLLGD